MKQKIEFPDGEILIIEYNPDAAVSELNLSWTGLGGYDTISFLDVGIPGVTDKHFVLKPWDLIFNKNRSKLGIKMGNSIKFL